MPYTAHPTHRKTLNPAQRTILATLYRFRFATTELLTQTTSPTVSRRYMHTRLRILCDQEYVGRRYDSHYKLQGKFASYYLLPKGIEVLRQQPADFRPSVLRQMRNDRLATERSIQHRLSIFALYATMYRQYGRKLKFFTGSYLHSFDYFPKPLPDAYVSLVPEVATEQTNHYILECFDETMTAFAMKKRINALVAHADGGDWTPAAPYPSVILVCYSRNVQQRVERWVRRALEDAWSENLTIRVTLQDRVAQCIMNV